MHGQFVWNDLMTSDPAAAQRFYPAITGWKTQKFEQASPENPYTMWTVEGEPIGGVAQITNEQRAMGVPPHWLPSVQVNNVDETIKQATSLGGKVVAGPMEVPDTGRYAVLQDPQGATLAIFKPQGSATTFDGTPSVGRHSWYELTTTDSKAALEFYRKLFGWEITSEMDMGPSGTYKMFGLKGKMYGGMYNRPPEMANVPPNWLPYVYVKDLKNALDRATKAGAKVVNGPMDVPGGSVAVLSDPQGAAFALHQGAPAKPSAKPKAAKPKAKARTATRKAKTVRARPKPKAKARPKAKAKSRTRPTAKKTARRSRATRKKSRSR